MIGELLAEAGMSECARSPEVAACRELSDGLFAFVIGIPIAIVCVCAVGAVLVVISRWHREVVHTDDGRRGPHVRG